MGNSCCGLFQWFEDEETVRLREEQHARESAEARANAAEAAAARSAAFEKSAGGRAAKRGAEQAKKERLAGPGSARRNDQVVKDWQS